MAIRRIMVMLMIVLLSVPSAMATTVVGNGNSVVVINGTTTFNSENVINSVDIDETIELDTLHLGLKAEIPCNVKVSSHDADTVQMNLIGSASCEIKLVSQETDGITQVSLYAKDNVVLSSDLTLYLYLPRNMVEFEAETSTGDVFGEITSQNVRIITSIGDVIMNVEASVLDVDTSIGDVEIVLPNATKCSAMLQSKLGTIQNCLGRESGDETTFIKISSVTGNILIR